MNKKGFLEKNKNELAEIINKLNKENDESFADYLMATAIEIEKSTGYRLGLKDLENRLLKEVENLNNDNNYADESFDDSDTVLIDNENLYTVDPLQQYRNEIERYPLLTAEKEKELFIRYKNGDESAKELLINSNLRLVMKIAKRYKGSGIKILDLIQEGNIGLVKAVERFDVKKGNKLSTYATWWIRQAITRYIPSAYLQYSIPVHVEEKKWQIYKALDKIYYQTGKEATDEQISKATGIEVAEVRRIRRVTSPATSTNMVINDDKDSSLEDFIPEDENKKNIEQINMLKQLKEDLYKTMNECLTEKEKKIIIDRFGFEDNHVRTLEEVSQDYNVTRERIRQIEAKALKKMYRKAENTSLHDYLDNI